MGHLRWFLLAVALLGGCVADVGIPGAHGTQDEGTLPSQADSAEERSCAPMPPLATSAFETYEGGLPYHWPVSAGCIPVTYEPDLAEFADELAQATAVWNDVGCSTLVLCAPQARSTLLTFQREWEGGPLIHLTTQDLASELSMNPGDWFAGISHLQVVNATGQLRFAAIQLAAEEAREMMSPANWTRLVGSSIGFESSTDPGSVLTRGAYVQQGDPDQRSGELAQSDVESLCTLYGDPPLCPEPQLY